MGIFFLSQTQTTFNGKKNLSDIVNNYKYVINKSLFVCVWVFVCKIIQYMLV